MTGSADNGRYVGFSQGGKTVCIAIAAHKAYRMPDDPMYMPLQVGKALHPEVDLGFQPDNAGDNISELNASYSELTAIYWLWKNCSANYMGLAHYRRHFASRHYRGMNRFDRIVRHPEVLKLLQSTDIILPRKRNYYIETMHSHYVHTHPAVQLEEARRILEEYTPGYLRSFDQMMNSRSGHMFNMFIMSREKFNEYCTWLFPILEELTKRIDSDSYDAFKARYPGRVSELLLDVWLKKKNYSYEELPIISTEPTNWWEKGTGFLLAKYAGKQYTKSF